MGMWLWEDRLWLLIRVGVRERSVRDPGDGISGLENKINVETESQVIVAHRLHFFIYNR